MIGALPYLPITSDQDQGMRSWENLSEVNKERLASIVDSLFILLSPLAQVSSRMALDDLLRARSSRFVQLKSRLWDLLWPTLEAAEMEIGGLQENLREIILNKADLLGEEATQSLLGAIDSDESFTEWSMKVAKQSPYRLGTVVQQVGESVLYSAMCINALTGVLADRISDWVPEAIPVLAQAADDFMTEVEDVFLANSLETDESGEVVDYESLRKELGL